MYFRSMSYQDLVNLLTLAEVLSYEEEEPTARKYDISGLVKHGWAEYGDTVTNEGDDDYGYPYVRLTKRGERMAELLLATAKMYAVNV